MFAFAISLAICYMLIPAVRQLAIRSGRISQTRKDRWSETPTPFLGGIAIYLAFLIGLLVGTRNEQLPLTLIAGTALTFFVGVIDDFRTLNPAAKMGGILLSASIMVFGGYSTAFFDNNLANILISLVWIAGITNAFNLLDNMDGLAAGTALVVSLFLSFIFFRAGNEVLLIVSLALAGSVLAFWRYNFPPASIYMGDSGSLFIGMLLATMSIANEPQASNVFAIVAVPSMIFLLPILDTVLVSITRIFRGQSPVQGGRDHTSHRLILLGLSERQTLFILLAVAVLSGVTAVLIENLSYSLSLFLVPGMAVFFALMSAYLGQVKVTSSLENESSERALIPRRERGYAFRRRLLEIILDFFLILFAAFSASLVLEVSFDGVTHVLPVIMAVSFLYFYLLGVYHFLWRYIGLNEMMRLFLAAAMTSLTSILIYQIFFSVQRLSPSFFGGFGLILFALVASTRLSFRLLEMAFRQARLTESEPVLIFGAGDAGDLVLRECQGNEDLKFRVIGFVDDDPAKVGRIVHGISVLGNTAHLAQLVADRQVCGIIIATGSPLEPAKTKEILEIAKANNIWVRRFSLELELL